MLDSTFRPEAIEAYNERWLGERSVGRSSSFRFLPLAGVLLIGLLIAILARVSYARRTTISGAFYPVPGTTQVVARAFVSSDQLPALEKGKQVRLSFVAEPGREAVTLNGRISSVAAGAQYSPCASPTASPQPALYTVEIEVPQMATRPNGPPLAAMASIHFASTLELERHPVYQWMFPSLMRKTR